MRILLVIDSLGSGGAQRQMVTLAAGLTGRGHQVDIFTYHDEDHFAPVALNADVALHVHPKPSRYSFKPVFALRRLLINGHFDCVLAFLETPCVYAELARLGRSAPPLIVSERFMYSRDSLGWLGRAKQELHRLADRITVNSHHQGQTMIQMFPWMTSRLSVIWNGVDLDHFAATPLPEPVHGVLRLQVLASVARKKNALGLAKAIVRCRDAHGLHVLVNWAGATTVSGEGDRHWQETMAFLQAANASAQWQWQGSMIDVRPLLADCDVVAHPSFAEGLPNAISEAFSCGRPVLASRTGDHARLIDGGANGALFDPSDPDSIADAIVAHARLSPEGRQAKADAARRFAEQQLSTERLVQAYEQLLLAQTRGYQP